MRQTSLFSFSKEPGLAPGTAVVDLFCGIGGFSHGAKMAGHRVVLAVDCDPFLIGAHVRNNPDCRHICCKLPRDDLPLPTEERWHLHASPPCQKLSHMQPHRHADDRRRAVDAVEWFFQLVLEKRPSSWSFEQVNHAAIRERLSCLKRRYPLLFDWTVADAVDYGVPQVRKRIVAGSPFLIANMRTRKCKRKRCVRDVIPDPPREYVRNSLYSRPDYYTQEYVAVELREKLRSVDEPCWTILATGHKKWASAEGEVLRLITGREAALIQSFPPEYKLPWSLCASLVGAGNAFPPLMARALMTVTTLK